MQPAGFGPAAPIRLADTIDIPVRLRYTSPLAPERRPSASRIDHANKLWTVGHLPPVNGFYLVPTTWRAIMDAAIATGRDPRDWLSVYPRLARLEFLVRTTPLRAYLGLRTVNGNPRALVNDVYLNGTEKTAQAAAGYRIGMTMAEFTARTLLGLGPTAHAEVAPPAGAGPAWANNKRQPDLVAYSAGLPWLIEAKGGKKVGLPALRVGARQLAAVDLMAGPHVRVLCGASLTHRLFLTVDIELPRDLEERRLYWARQEDSSGFTVELESRSMSAAAADLARSRMLIYYAVSSAAPEDRFVRRFVGENGRDVELDSWAVQPVEATQSISNQQRSRDEISRLPRDVIGARIVGTGLAVGLTTQLFAACRAGAQHDRAAAEQADTAQPRASVADNDSVDDLPASRSSEPSSVDPIITARAATFGETYDRRRGQADDDIRSAWDSNRLVTAEDLLGDERPQVRVGPSPSVLEAMGAGTYIAVDRDTIPNLD